MALTLVHFISTVLSKRSVSTNFRPHSLFLVEFQSLPSKICNSSKSSVFFLLRLISSTFLSGFFRRTKFNVRCFLIGEKSLVKTTLRGKKINGLFCWHCDRHLIIRLFWHARLRPNTEFQNKQNKQCYHVIVTGVTLATMCIWDCGLLIQRYQNIKFLLLYQNKFSKW